MSEAIEADATMGDEGPANQIEEGSPVTVFSGTDSEQRGTVVADFGEMSGHAVDIGDNHFADPARRYAVSLDSGELLFVDAESVTLN